jgi:hypothetical protein
VTYLDQDAEHTSSIENPPNSDFRKRTRRRGRGRGRGRY